jgi:type I restriction enzyme, S subunit
MNNVTIRLLEKHFDIAFAAPDGIKKLRELILTLAMQGKLMPQDSKDQPASELLKEIEAEKQMLVKERKIKAPKSLPETRPEEFLYAVPNTWKWVRLGEIVSILGDGLHGTPTYDETGDFFFINGNNLSNGIIKIKENTKKVSIHEYQKHKKELNSRTVLVSINGTLGNVAFYNNENVILGKSACYFNLLKKIDKQFIKKLLNSEYFLEYVLLSATGTTIKNVSLQTMREFLFPLPPLAEQHRIVAKIDELMARCDELEKLRGDRNRSLTTVHTAALNRLLMAKESSDFSTAWSFITQHFGELYSVKENVAELRKAILQLAVMGKLVPQDPNDEPASELLKAIKVEKQRLVKEGKIKQPNQSINIKSEEVPYLLPKNWEWVKLGEILPDYQNGISKRNSIEGTERIVIRLADIKIGEIFLDDPRLIRLTEEESKKYELTTNDILITRVNGSTDLIGSFTLIKSQGHLTYCDHFIRLRISQDFISSVYLCKVAKSFLLREQIISKFVTTAGQKTVNQSHISSLIIPLPPIAEQYRIVAKIDQLMALCDRLEQQIDNAATKQTALLNVVMTKF